MLHGVQRLRKVPKYRGATVRWGRLRSHFPRLSEIIIPVQPLLDDINVVRACRHMFLLLATSLLICGFFPSARQDAYHLGTLSR